MKNYKSLILIFALIVGLGTLSSCKKTKVTEKDAIEFTYVEEGKEKPANGEFLLYNLEILTQTDSVIYSTLTQPQPAPIKEDDLIKVRLGAYDVKSEADMQAFYEEAMAKEQAKAAERAKTLLVEEAKTIEAYISKNNLKAQKTESGLYYVIEKEGTGEATTPGTTLSVNYAGYLITGALFDTSYPDLAKANNMFSEERPYEPLPVNVGMGQVIPGWDEGLMLLKKGSKAKLIIPSPLGYGESGAGALIPANSILVFDVEVTDSKK